MTMTKCSKCLTEASYAKKYAIFQETGMTHYSLCYMCDREFEGIEARMLLEFLQDDFGIFPISQQMKDQINKKRNRAIEGANEVR